MLEDKMKFKIKFADNKVLYNKYSSKYNSFLCSKIHYYEIPEAFCSSFRKSTIFGQVILDKKSSLKIHDFWSGGP